jgi:hypothetical protein
VRRCASSEVVKELSAEQSKLLRFVYNSVCNVPLEFVSKLEKVEIERKILQCVCSPTLPDNRIRSNDWRELWVSSEALSLSIANKY